MVFEEDRAAVRQHDAQLRRGEAGRLSYRVKRSNGVVVWLRENATPARDAAGRVVLGGLLSDVTQHKEAEEILIHQRQIAEATSNMKTAFVRMMSHEVRTPLGTVKGFADLLAEELDEYAEEAAVPLPPPVVEFCRGDSRQRAPRPCAWSATCSTSPTWRVARSACPSTP